MDAPRRPQLPALSYLDIDKVKREEEFYQHRHTGSGASQSLSSSAGASPTYHYPPGPPPPYSHAHGGPPPPTMHANNWPGTQQAVRTPPAREHEREGAKQNARQSLPSISEALGVDRQTPFASSQPQPQAQPPPPQSTLQHPHSHISRPPSVAPASPPASARRSYPMEPPPPTSYPSSGNSYPQFSQYRSEPTQQPSYTPAPAPAPEQQAPVRQQAPQPGPHPPASYSRPAESYEPPPPPPPPQAQQAGSMAPPAVPYGYTPYPPRYANSTPAPPPPAPAPPAQATSAGPIYQPSTLYAPPPQQGSSGWKAESNARYEDRQSGPAAYGDNVKRHLDFYDLESALNEISNTSGILSDFSRRYGDRMHHTQRSGPALSTLPGIVEVDDMVSKSRVQLDSLLKIRDVILAQQAVYEQQAADQRHHKAFNEPSHQSQADANQQESDDGKVGGFAGVDTKKRRGRAAPPGRCHSCNRAETPEWRRGPDGARTLCNACGLHYAKLTRKNQGANKNTAMGGSSGSNLRPKETLG